MAGLLNRPNRLSERPGDVPPVSNSAPNHFVLDASDRGPLGQHARFASKRHPIVAARVIDPLSSSSPTAIARLVIAVGVDSVKGRSSWTRPHVAVEDRKVCHPRGVHCYPPPSVVGETPVVVVAASPLCCGPGDIFWRGGEPVPTDAIAQRGSPETPTTPRVPFPKATRVYKSGSPAVAGAFPPHGFVDLGRSALHDQASEPLSSQIQKVHTQMLSQNNNKAYPPAKAVQS